MTQLSIYTLKVLRKLYSKVLGKELIKPNCEQDPEKASLIIYEALTSDKPCMISRFGSTELTCITNYLGVQKNKKEYLNYIQGKTAPWWYNTNNIDQMQLCSGFFPATIDKIEEFCKLMIKDTPQVDILGSWLNIEFNLEDKLNAKKVHLRLLEPFWSKKPWTSALEGKKILVVHPFNKVIEEQYKIRQNLFKSKDVLPTFKSLVVIKAVQSIGKGDNRFKDWFEALDYKKNEIDKVDYDICLIGAGAYGFPLAAHVKRKGKKSVHLGGSLQLLFGIKGKRWEDPNYGVKEWGVSVGSYSELMNEYWVKPGEKFKPKKAEQVEGACYW